MQRPSALMQEFLSPTAREEVSALLSESNVTAGSIQVVRLADCDESAMHSEPPITPSNISAPPSMFAKPMPQVRMPNVILENITNKAPVREKLAGREARPGKFKITEDSSSSSSSSSDEEEQEEEAPLPRLQPRAPLSNIKEMPVEDSKLEDSKLEESEADESMAMDDVKQDMFKTHFSEQKVIPPRLEEPPASLRKDLAKDLLISPREEQNESLKLQRLAVKRERATLRLGMGRWRLEGVRRKAKAKIDSAHATVEKMTNFSRSFLALVTLQSVLMRKRAQAAAGVWAGIREHVVFKNQRENILFKLLRRQNMNQVKVAWLSWRGEAKKTTPIIKKVENVRAKGFVLKMLASRWRNGRLRKAVKEWKGGEGDFEAVERNCELELRAEKAEREAKELKGILAEYSQWKAKLENIERQMKQENQVWKATAERVASQNETLTKQANLLKQELSQKSKQLAAAQTKLAKGLDPVEEALCPNCKNSLEESQIFKRPLLSPQNSGRNDAKIEELEEKLREKEHELGDLLRSVERIERERKLEAGKEVIELREKLEFAGQLEAELKRKAEEHVDVVLRMEQERLVILQDKEQQRLKSEEMLREMEEVKEMLQKCGTQLASLSAENSALKEAAAAAAAATPCKSIELESAQKSPPPSQFTSASKEPKKRAIGKPSVPGVKKPVKSANSGWKSLKFDRGNTGQAPALGTIPAKEEEILQHENTVLTNDLIIANRELQRLKLEFRQTQQRAGKAERERAELEKALGSKAAAVDRLREENGALATALNADQNKSLRFLEHELNQLKDKNKQLNSAIEQQDLKTQGLQSELNTQGGRVEALEKEKRELLEREKAMKQLLGEVDNLQETIGSLRGTVATHEAREVRLESETESLRMENAKMKENVEWLASSARASKLHADKAEKDLQTYIKILRVMEQKLEQQKG